MKLKKTSIIFTWDDNAIRHNSYISKVFIKEGFRCTFYINPGVRDFNALFAKKYAYLHKKGFDIGSHGYTHRYMTKLSEIQVGNEFSKSIEAIKKTIGTRPLSFAFPFHDYNAKLIKEAKKYYLETRNTLANSIRYGIKTKTSLQDLIDVINDTIYHKTNLIFSGHSIVTENECNNNKLGEGYEPMPFNILCQLLNFLKSKNDYVDIITFSQAVLREHVRENSKKNHMLLNALKKFEITEKNILTFL